jgi:FkbM family methyltransferase
MGQAGARLRRALSRARLRADRFAFSRRVRISPHPNLRRLGTPYGGWVFADVPELRNCVVISCGLGEDASFDVEFASQYGAHMLLVDPTPRATVHFHEIEARIGQGRQMPYVDGGKQPVDAYDLSEVTPGQLTLADKAVSGAAGRVRFYAPKDPAHVSHSIVNFQNDYSTSTPSIEVETVTLEMLIALIDRSRLQILKLDIEGAEIAVVDHMVKRDIRPPQLCIEFDELGVPTARAFADFFRCHALLERARYRVADFDGVSSFLYLQPSVYPPG